MNPAERRKQILQTVVLVILLGVLGYSMFYMLRAVGAVGRRPPQPQPTATAEPPHDELVAGATAVAPEISEALSREQLGAPAGLNPNLFRIYQLDPPKNPFLQEEAWYAEELSQYPGYPVLRDEEYFESLEAYVPELEGLLEEDDAWTEARLERVEQLKQWSLEGHSEDEQIATRLTLTGPPPQTTTLEWNRSMGVPLNALAHPGWEGAVSPELAAVPPDLTDGDDLFQPPPGLVIPGLTDGVDGLLTGGLVSGDQVFCHGVSGVGSRATALLTYNGAPTLVSAGDSLPPRYRVEAITGDGVVLVELRSGEARWLPITAPMAPDGSDSGSGGANQPRLPTPTA